MDRLNPGPDFGRISEAMQKNIQPVWEGHAESYLETFIEHVQEMEGALGPRERLAFVHSQTGEPIQVQRVVHRGPAIILYGVDQAGRRASVFANVGSLQIAFRVVSVEGQKEREPIGFSTK